MANTLEKPGLTGEQVYQEREKKSKSTATIPPVIPNDPQQYRRCGEDCYENGRASARQPPTEDQYLKKSEVAVREIAAAVQRTKWENVTKEVWEFFQLSIHQIELYADAINKEHIRLVTEIRKPPFTPPHTPPSIGPKTTSWANLVSRPSPATTSTPQAYLEKEDARKAKRVTIRVDDQEEKKQLLAATLTQVVDTFKSAGGPAESIIAAHRARGGDIILQTATIEARESLERNEDWARRACSSARTLRQTTPVVIHGVRIAAINEKDQRATIEAIKGANRTLHPGLEIVKVEWPVCAHRTNGTGEKKKFSSLVVEVTSPEAANRLIEEGLAFEGTILFCDSWVRNSNPHQCFNCYGYGHIGRACKHPIRCGFCAGNHATNDHEKVSPGVQKCATCGGKHPAWSKDCPIPQKEKARIMNKVNAKPKFYRVPARTTVNLLPPFKFGPINGTTSGPDAEGFQPVASRKRRSPVADTNKISASTSAKRGRPTTQAKLAEPEAGQKMIQQSQPKPQVPTSSAPTEDVEMSGEVLPPPTQ